MADRSSSREVKRQREGCRRRIISRDEVQAKTQFLYYFLQSEQVEDIERYEIWREELSVDKLFCE